MKIAVDAMGGDNAPQVVVEGIEQARDDFSDIEFTLYGDEKQINSILKNNDRITVVHTEEQILGTDEPVKAVRKKKNSSMVLAATSVKNEENDAMLSLGNSGALLASGIFVVGRIKGVDRPAMMTILPNAKNEKGTIYLDSGANAETKVTYLLQWAEMASLYAKDIQKIENPKVALLNNGEEFDKGDQLHQETYQALDKSEELNFVGNIEAFDIVENDVNVIVTDGFTGNATLKSAEGTAKTIVRQLKNTLLNSGFKTKLGAAMIAPALKQMSSLFDTSKSGGAVLIGLKAPVVKAHGSADSTAVYYSVKQIRDIIEANVVEKFTNSVNE